MSNIALISETDLENVRKFYENDAGLEYGTFVELITLIKTIQSLSIWIWDEKDWSSYMSAYEVSSNQTPEQFVVYRLGKDIKQKDFKEDGDEFQKVSFILYSLRKSKQFYDSMKTGKIVMYEH